METIFVNYIKYGLQHFRFTPFLVSPFPLWIGLKEKISHITQFYIKQSLLLNDMYVLLVKNIHKKNIFLAFQMLNSYDKNGSDQKRESLYK